MIKNLAISVQFDIILSTICDLIFLDDGSLIRIREILEDMSCGYGIQM